jgi:hypothetical protein
MRSPFSAAQEDTMFEAYVASELYKMNEKRIERQARDAWRFRHLKSREAQVATALLTSVLSLFIR